MIIFLPFLLNFRQTKTQYHYCTRNCILRCSKNTTFGENQVLYFVSLRYMLLRMCAYLMEFQFSYGHVERKHSHIPKHVSVSRKIPLFSSQKHAYTVLTPLNSTFVQQNWGLEGYTLLFFSAQNKYCGYSLEQPRWGSSNKYPQSVLSRTIKTTRIFI